MVLIVRVSPNGHENARSNRRADGREVSTHSFIHSTRWSDWDCAATGGGKSAATWAAGHGWQAGKLKLRIRSERPLSISDGVEWCHRLVAAPAAQAASRKQSVLGISYIEFGWDIPSTFRGRRSWGSRLGIAGVA